MPCVTDRHVRTNPASSRGRSPQGSAPARTRGPRRCKAVGSRSLLCLSGEEKVEVVVADVPTALLALPSLVGWDAAVCHPHRRRAVLLRELELDQLRLIGLIVPDPGEDEPAR